jgi:hypothetical protein
MKASVVIGLNAVIMAVTDGELRVLTVRRTSHSLTHRPTRRGAASDRSPGDAFPFGPFEPTIDRTLELGLRRWVREQAGIELGYAEQLYTFGNRFRDPGEKEGGPRVVSVAYLALVREAKLSGTGDALWSDWYRYLPWEDWRQGRPEVIDGIIAPALAKWVRQAESIAPRRLRRERCDIHFGLHGTPWDPERVIDRCELLYEAGLAAEAARDAGASWPTALSEDLGRPMAYDHRRLLASALGRLRGKIKYRPVVFELLPREFTLLQLQRVAEAIAGVRLHKQNLRRLVEKGGLVEGTGRIETQTGGRPAELFCFRREVLRERPAPGVGLPGLRLG